MKPFLQFLKEDLSSVYHDLIAPYEEFPPSEPLDQENEIYNDIQFTDFPHYMMTQISVVSRYIATQGIGNDPKAVKAALEDAFMKPEIQQAFRLHYARKFPTKVTNK